jgi:hypothetical protein
MSPFTRPMPAATSSTTSTATAMLPALPRIISAAMRLERLTT